MDHRRSPREEGLGDPSNEPESFHTCFFKECEVAGADVDKGRISVNAMLDATAQIFCGDNS